MSAKKKTVQRMTKALEKEIRDLSRKCGGMYGLKSACMYLLMVEDLKQMRKNLDDCENMTLEEFCENEADMYNDDRHEAVNQLVADLEDAAAWKPRGGV